MKASILSIFKILVSLLGFSQNPEFSLDPGIRPAVKIERLPSAKTIHDINPDFCRQLELPWRQRQHLNTLLNRQNLFLVSSQLNSYGGILNAKYNFLQKDFDNIITYQSVEIVTFTNGKSATAIGKNEILTKEQKRIIQNADQDSEIRVKIRFMYKNHAYDLSDKEELVKEGEFVVKVVPETEAIFPGGLPSLSEYLLKNMGKNMPTLSKDQFLQDASVKFVVDTDGRMSNHRISRTTGVSKVDKFLLEIIRKMPEWKPAKNAKGQKVKQEIEIPFSSNGGC
jgi:TonB family protein